MPRKKASRKSWQDWPVAARKSLAVPDGSSTKHKTFPHHTAFPHNHDLKLQKKFGLLDAEAVLKANLAACKLEGIWVVARRKPTYPVQHPDATRTVYIVHGSKHKSTQRLCVHQPFNLQQGEEYSAENGPYTPPPPPPPPLPLPKPFSLVAAPLALLKPPTDPPPPIPLRPKPRSLVAAALVCLGIKLPPRRVPVPSAGTHGRDAGPARKRKRSQEDSEVTSSPLHKKIFRSLQRKEQLFA